MGLFDVEKTYQDWEFDPQMVNYSPSEGLMGSIESLKGVGTAQTNLGKEFTGAYRQMLDPGSAYNQRMFKELRRSSSDMLSQGQYGMNQALASRGIGSGGMSNLLSTAMYNTAGENLRKGFLGIQDTSLGRAGQFGGMASGAYSGAGQTFGAVGGLFGQIDRNTLSASMQNAQTRNAYEQYLRQSQYNQNLANNEAVNAQRGQMLGLIGDVAGAFATGGLSLIPSLINRGAGSNNTYDPLEPPTSSGWGG